MLIEEMARVLKKRYPEGRFVVLSWQILWIQDINPEIIEYPGDYYYDPNEKIIRRRNTLIDHFYVSASEEA